jgi:hypothetical protein
MGDETGSDAAAGTWGIWVQGDRNQRFLWNQRTTPSARQIFTFKMPGSFPVIGP